MNASNFRPRNAELLPQQWWEAIRLWQNGYDTKEIASIFGVTEAVIYNGLPRYLEMLAPKRKTA